MNDQREQEVDQITGDDERPMAVVAAANRSRKS